MDQQVADSQAALIAATQSAADAVRQEVKAQAEKDAAEALAHGELNDKGNDA